MLALGTLPGTAAAGGQATASRAAAQTVTEHYVSLRSTAPAIAGQDVRLYVRERVRTDRANDPREGRVVVLVHGGGTPSEVGFDLGYGSYSWAAYLADAGFDVFAVDLTGYGRSTRTAVMDNPCNLSVDQQRRLIPKKLSAPCDAAFTGELTTIASDWDDIDAVVAYIRRLRNVKKMSLIGWSRGGPRVGGYALLHPEYVSRIVMLAPSYVAEAPDTDIPARVPPFGIQDRAQFMANWNRMVGCPSQYDPGVADAVWTALLDSDPVGSAWGQVRRAPAH